MSYLSTMDYAIILIYLSILIGLGFYLAKKASNNLNEYFLGGHKIPWWAMGLSGMASWLDIAGTMLIISFIFMLGPRGLYIEFRGGVGLVLIFTLLWTGKWHYRSGCMTGAEWMEYRFGSGIGGQAARIMSAVARIVLTIGLLSYMITGVGLFLSTFLPFSPLTCSIIMIGVATIYTLCSGFYGVVYTDIFQSVIIMSATILIIVLAVSKIASPEQLSHLATEITGNSQWTSSALHWKTSMPAGYEAYQYLMFFAIFYLLRNVLGGMGVGDDPKYFGARNERECGTLSFLWGTCMVVRWPLIMGISILGLYLMKDLFPDQGILLQAAELIKSYFPDVTKSEWTTLLSSIQNAPQNYSKELISGLEGLFHSGWKERLLLIGYEGGVNPERVMPAVLFYVIPYGTRGLLLVALLAASMSTFDSTVNSATAFFTRDIYQRYLRPKAKNRELINISYVFIILMVASSFFMAETIKSINDIWGWIAMGLTAGMIIPNFLRFYWWRFNGTGFALGMIIGMLGAFIQRALWPDLVEWQMFLILIFIGLTGSIVASLLTSPTDDKTLWHFYQTTRPFGLWGRYKKRLPENVRTRMEKEHKNDLLAVPFTFLWNVTLLLLPMQLLIRTYKSFFITLSIFLFALGGMYWFWYRHLPPAEEKQ